MKKLYGTNWKPSESDIAWMKRVIGLLKESGTWGIPESESFFTFHHSKKTYKFSGDREHTTNRRTMRILDILEWKEDE